MTKKIVIFSDGTGNSSAKSQKTNVWRVYKALDLSPDSKQIAYYDNGVGTSSFRPLAIAGGAFGLGLARNVRQIYGFMCRTYQQGDEIYCFGFSRGAFTVRVVAAFIAHQGIIDIRKTNGEDDLDRLIKIAYETYRRECFSNSGLAWVFRPVRNQLSKIKNLVFNITSYDPKLNLEYSKNVNASQYLIRFLGLWDTVDAYGLPIDELTRAWDRLIWPLTAKDRNLSSRVQRACHALALDEQRESFEPMLWNEAHEKVHSSPYNISEERLSQVWFAGVHSNVGGGYPDDAMSLIPLKWIMTESSKQNGLKFLQQECLQLWESQNLNGKVYDSRHGFGAFYRLQPRHLERLANEKKPGLAIWIKSWWDKNKLNLNEVKINQHKIHHTVLERIKTNGDRYAPINLPAHYSVVQEDGKVLDIAQSIRNESGESVLTPDSRHNNEAEETISCFEQSSTKYILPEDNIVAQHRKERQELTWNKVWLRRRVYGATIFTVIIFLLFPFIAPQLSESSATGAGVAAIPMWLIPFFGTLNEFIQSIPQFVSKLPGLGFAHEFFARFTKYPYFFCLFLIAVGLFLVLSRKLKKAINNSMRSNWHHVADISGSSFQVITAFQKKLVYVRNSNFYQRGVRRSIELSAEFVAILFFAYLLLALISRITFIALDGIGSVCSTNDSGNSLSPDREGFSFNRLA